MANGGLWGDDYAGRGPTETQIREEKMGDHRVTIRIILDFHGHKADSGEMYLNWWSNAGGELPGGARDWLAKQHTEGMARFHTRQREDEERQEARRMEEVDKKTYARLYAKFGGKDPSQQRRD